MIVQKVDRMKFFISFFLLSILVVSCNNSKVEDFRLPIAGNTEVLERIVDGKIVFDTIYHTIPAFSYFDQDSNYVNNKSFGDKVLIVDFMFTNCPSICPPMTTNMKRLNIMTQDLADNVEFLSFSIDPYRDRPSRLKEYIQEHGIQTSNWRFLTNNNEDLTHELAGSFFNYAEKSDSIPGGYGHTSYFSLVDSKGRVRGVYDGLDSKAVDLLEKELRILLKTEYGVK